MVPEMEEHLGYEKHAKSVVKNSRNGRTSKRIKTKMVNSTTTEPRVLLIK
jgi:transposase-like protein